MRRLLRLALLLTLLTLLPASSLAGTRALLVACSSFLSQPELGNAVSGNLQMIGSALLGAQPRLASLSIEDGTIGTPQALDAAISDAFSGATEEDLSILYLCTHGVLSSSDDQTAYLLLGDGQTESMLTGDQLYDMIAGIQGEKLLILDACYSGALIGRSAFGDQEASAAPFLSDPSVHVLTSADGNESSWYFDSESLSTGAVSYFASALSSGLGLYGAPEADLSGYGRVTLAEMHRYLNVAVPSSSSQLLSTAADAIALPTTRGAMLTRPLAGFSYGESLLTADDPTLEFSFTVTRETAIQYRVVDFVAGGWNWAEAKVFLDGAGTLSPGRKTRELTLSDVAPQDSGYVMLQVFALAGDELILCSERLIGVQPAASDAQLLLACEPRFVPGARELPIGVRLGVPAELSVAVYDAEGALVRRLCAGQLTHPTPDDGWHIAWDGRDSDGFPVPAGAYTVAAEAVVSGVRQRATAVVIVPGPQGQ